MGAFYPLTPEEIEDGAMSKSWNGQDYEVTFDGGQYHEASLIVEEDLLPILEKMLRANNRRYIVQKDIRVHY
jgi:hypothetical protein